MASTIQLKNRKCDDFTGIYCISKLWTGFHNQGFTLSDNANNCCRNVNWVAVLCCTNATDVYGGFALTFLGMSEICILVQEIFWIEL